MPASFAIGDIHGCNRTLNVLLEQLPLKRGDRLIFLGDYIDRGPDSKGVIDTILRLRQDGFDTLCLRGNHEQMLLEALRSPAELDGWLVNGGAIVLQNFGVKHPVHIPAPYLDFVAATGYSWASDDYVCVHGGPDWRAADPLANPEALLWSRRWYDRIDYQWLGKRVVLHGHTPMAMEEIEAQLDRLDEQQYLNLDNGAVYAHVVGPGRRKGLGNLLAFGLDDRKLYRQQNIETR